MRTSWSPYWKIVQNIHYLRLKPLPSLGYMFFFGVVCRSMLDKLKNFVHD